MDTNIEKDTPCSSIAVESIVRVGTAGALWGLCSGSYDANKLGLAGFARASFVAKSIGVTSFQCGTNSMQTKNVCWDFFLDSLWNPNLSRAEDVINAAAAGALVGAAIAVGTRSKKEVAGVAALLSILGAAADYSRTL